MRKLFVDTSAWVGLYVTNDQWHQDAVRFKRWPGQNYRWITTNWIIWETVTWLRSHRDHTAAVSFVEQVRSTSVLETITVTTAYETRAWELFKRYDDKEFSFVDCASFAVMDALALTLAFTFDDHFRQVGYQAVPQIQR